jgi:K+-transporting ATPase KdpF subunit
MAYLLRTGLLLGFVLLGPGLVICCAGRGKMNTLYVLSGVISLGLLVYLFVALLMPEKFG